MAITPLPTPPSRSTPSDFSAKADAFIAALPTFVTETNEVAAAMNLNDTTASSTTSLAIGTGSKSLTVDTAKSYQPGMSVKIARTSSPSNWMHGDVTSYNAGTGELVVNVLDILGSGTFTDWTVTFSAPSLNPSQWTTISGHTFTYVSATEFTVDGDQTDIYTATRRIKGNVAGGAVYSEVVTSSYASPNTTVTIKDAVLTDPITSIEHSLFSPTANDGALSEAMLGIFASLKTAPILPSGLPLSWPSETCPAWAVPRFGTSYLIADYPGIYAVIGKMYGSVDANHFNVPDDRGIFERYWANGQSTDPDRAARTAPTAMGATIAAGDHVGTEQDHQIESHTHSNAEAPFYNNFPYGATGGGGFNSVTSKNIGLTGGNQTNPINRAYMPIMVI